MYCSSSEFGNQIFTDGVKAELSFFIKQLQINFNDINDLFDRLTSLGLAEYDRPTFSQSVKLNSTRIKTKNLQLDMDSNTKQKELAVERLKSMVDFVYTDKCRFRFILNYFGEDDNTYRCGKCDNCTGRNEEIESIDDFVEEKIYELLDEFQEGLKQNDIIQILLGSSEDIDHLTSELYASCAHFDSEKIKECIQRMLNRYEVEKSTDGMFTLPGNAPEPEQKDDYEDYLELFNKLREIRKEVSQRFNQAAQMVCPDDVLKEIAEKKPDTLTALLAVTGFNQRMYNKLGEDILRTVNELKERSNESAKLKDNKVPDSIKQILELVKKRYSLADISSLTRLPEAVISMQIETLLGLFPALDIDPLMDIKKADTIRDKISEGYSSLKELKALLPNDISYAEIRIVLAKENVL